MRSWVKFEQRCKALKEYNPDQPFTFKSHVFIQPFQTLTMIFVYGIAPQLIHNFFYSNAYC